MAFCFRADESVAKGTKRLVRKQADRALDELSHPNPSEREEAVHDARRRLKRIRALLRLVREALGKRRYDRENALFREAGRPLSEVRDARVLVTSYEELTRRFAASLSGRPFAKVRGALRQRQEAIDQRVFDLEDTLASVIATLQSTRQRVKKWTFREGGPSLLHGGLKKAYQRGLASFHAVLADQTTENLHTWRKRTKDLWYQLQLLSSLWPMIPAELVIQAHTLGDYLGDDHDLAVLRDVSSDPSFQVSHRAAVEVLLPLIDRRRSELQRAAQRLGQVVYRDKPKEFLRRLEDKH